MPLIELPTGINVGDTVQVILTVGPELPGADFRMGLHGLLVGTSEAGIQVDPDTDGPATTIYYAPWDQVESVEVVSAASTDLIESRDTSLTS